MMKKIAIMAFVFMLLSAVAFAEGDRFVEAVFESTGAVCVTEDAHMYGMPVGEGIRAGITSDRFELIKLKIHIICAGRGHTRQAGSWQRLWSPGHGAAMAAPFEAEGDWVLIMHFEGTGAILARAVAAGEAPEEDWRKPEEPKNRMPSLRDFGFNEAYRNRWLKPPAIRLCPAGAR